MSLQALRFQKVCNLAVGGLIFCFAVWSSRANGFELSPMSATLNLDGSSSSKRELQFLLRNGDDRETEVQIDLVRRVANKKGNEVRERTGDFQVAPRKVTLKPNSTALILLEYRGPNLGSEERAYRLIAKELSGELRLSYVASLYVASRQFKPQLMLGSSKATVRTIKSSEDKDSLTGSWIELEIENRGSAHQDLSSVQIKVARGVRERENGQQTAGIKEYLELSSDDLAAFGREAILAKSKRKFQFHIKSTQGLVQGQTPLRAGDLVSVELGVKTN